VNRKFVFTLCLALFTAALVPAAHAADDAIGQFVGPRTDMVIHIDMAKVDLDAFNTWYKKALDNSSLDQTKKDKYKADSDKQLGEGKTWAAKFTRAGGKDLYVIVQLSGFFNGELAEVVVPIAEGVDAAGLAAVVNPDGNPAAPDPNDPQAAAAYARHAATAVVGKNIIFAPAPFLEKLKTAQGQPRPDISEALTVGGDSPVHLAIAGQSFQKPAELLAGGRGNLGIVADPAFKGVTWTGLSLILPPQGSAHATMQAKDADAATAIVNSIDDHISAMKSDPTAKENLGENLDKVADGLKPTTDGTKVSVSLTQETLDALIPSMITKLDKAHSARAPAPAEGGDGAQ
jgi:hypothetical protein